MKVNLEELRHARLHPMLGRCDEDDLWIKLSAGRLWVRLRDGQEVKRDASVTPLPAGSVVTLVQE